MGPFATAAMILEVVFWIILLSVFATFVGALFKGLLEDIREHRRSAARRLTARAHAGTRRLPRRPA
jgi:hypothetical protein